MTIEEEQDGSVALIGMSGRFPGARGVDELWQNLLSGHGGIRPVTAEELGTAGVDPAVAGDPRYVRVTAPLADIALFDAEFFGFSPREAETTDPQLRLFLECAWEALESAGYRPDRMPDRTGVFAGSGFTTYLLRNLYSRPDLMADLHKLQLAAGNDRDALSTMVSYKLGLRGPSVSVQSFCSTSLAAVHLAVQSLLTFESDVALAGGVSIDLPQPAGYLFEEGGIVSPDGVVRSFDAHATGTVVSNGLGLVVLKRAEDAIRDGDHVHVLIRGSAMTNDGRGKVGYSAPGVEGQAAAIEDAIRVSGVDPRTIGYVECHATGTMLGDSVELSALNRAFGAVEAELEPWADRDRPVTVLGSLKPTHGHLDRASGVGGLIRAALAVEHGVLPGTPNYRVANPALAESGGRFDVLQRDRAWTTAEPRRAGVSSFGLGGTNVHMVLQQAPAELPRPSWQSPCLLVLSARDLGALDDATTRLRDHLAARGESDLADVAFTLQQSRSGYAARRFVVCDDLADAVKALGDPSRWNTAIAERRDPLVTLSHTAPVATPDRVIAELRAALPVPEDLEKLLIAAGLRVVKSGGQIAAEIEPGPVDSGARWFWEQIGQLWLAGVDWDFTVLTDGHRRRVALPAYPFRKARYWVDPGVPAPAEPTRATGRDRLADPGDWFYQPVWRQRPSFDDVIGERLRELGPWLVFADDSLSRHLIDALRAADADVVVARPGADFATEGSDFVLRPDQPEDHGELVDAVVARTGALPRTVVHGWSLALSQAPERSLAARLTEFETAQRWGFHAVQGTVRALQRHYATHPIQLVVLTGGALAVHGTDLVHPEQATLSGLVPVISQECTEISCRHVDMDPLSTAHQLLTEIASMPDTVVAYRNGYRWTRDFEPLPVPPAAHEAMAAVMPMGGTVLITGGLGDVGLVIAGHMARTRSARLVLTGSSPLPDRSAWETHLTRRDLSERALGQLRGLLAVEQAGAEVLVLAADVADVDAMTGVVHAAVERFGSIDLVVHGAGVSDPAYFGPVGEVTPALAGKHFRAKTGGFLVLREVLARNGLTPAGITLSSLAAVLGGLQFGAYAAANAALDAYAVQATHAGQGRWLTVDWEAWRLRPEQHLAPGTTIADYSMLPAEAVEVFDRALTLIGKAGHVVTSSGVLSQRMAEWVDALSHGSSGDLDEAGADSLHRHARPSLSTPYEPPAAGREHEVARIWSEVLGIEPVGAHDDFFELGGHSLLATQLVGRLRSRLEIGVSVLTVLEHPTVRLLTAAVTAGQGPHFSSATTEREHP